MLRYKMNNIGKIGIFVLVFLIVTTSVHALGVSPGRKTLFFEPGLEGTYDFTVLNSENKDMKLLIYVEGELSEYVFLTETLADMSSSDSSKQFEYRIKLPQNLEPGTRESNIVIREVPREQAIEGTFVGASTAVVTQLRIEVPYPGKYAKVDLKTSEVEEGILFLMAVNNFGTQDIVNVRAVVDIYGMNNEKVATIESGSKSINSKGREEITALWETKDFNSGKYYAIATVTYDGETTTVEKAFSIGEMLIEILDINVKDFKLGGIAKFNILIENKWSELVENVFAEFIIYDQVGDEIIRFKSASEDIQANSKEELVAFWDTEGIKEGVYDSTLLVHYNDKVTEKELRAVVSLNSIKVEFVGATAEAVAVRQGLNNQGLLMFVILILIVVNVAWFIYFKKRAKK